MSDVKPMEPSVLALFRERVKHEHPCKWITWDDAKQLLATINAKNARIKKLEAEIEGERIARHKVSDALAKKDQAMGVLFARLAAHKIDYSDVIS